MSKRAIQFGAIPVSWLLAAGIAHSEKKPLPGPVTMRLRLDKGDVRVLNLQYSRKTTTPTADRDALREFDVDLKLTVREVDPQGRYTFGFTYERIKAKGISGDGAVTE